MSLAALNLWSNSPEEGARVLGALLGVEPRQRDDGDGAHFTLTAGDLMLSIHPADESRVELAFIVENAATAVAECRQNGCALTSGPTERPYGVSAQLEAPGLTGLEIVQLHPKKA